MSSARTPALAFLVVCLAVFLVETTLMWFLQPLFAFDEKLEALIDAATLLLIMSPLLYFLFVQPMSRMLQQKTDAEQALQVVCQELESKVRERTSELEASNLSLQEEILQRCRAMAKLQVQGRLLDAVQQAVMATDMDGVIIYWNRFAEELLGRRQDDVRGAKLNNLGILPPEVVPPSSRLDVPGCGGEVEVARRDGSKLPVYMTCSPIWKPDGATAGFVYTLIDITERKQAEEAVRLSEEKYSLVVESSPTGICILQDKATVFANRRFFEILGRPEASASDIRPDRVVFPEDWPQVQALLEARRAGQPSGGYREWRIVIPDGSIRWISGRSVLIRMHGRDALLLNIQDVTERHVAEQALRESREALQQLSGRLISAQEDERQRVAQELHDSLGQTLNALRYMGERALEKAGNSNQSELAEGVQTMMRVIQSAVEEVRRISKALRPAVLDDLGLLATVSWFIREFHEAYPSIAVETSVQVVEARIPESLKITIFRIMQESMNNAAKYSRASQLSFGLREEGGHLQLSIEDNGVGFELAGQGPSEGSGGFGITSMKERAELSGGQFCLDSAPGKGTRVAVCWPVFDWAIS